MTCPTVLQNHDDVNKTIFSPDLQKHYFNQTQKIKRSRGGGCCIAIFATRNASRRFIKSFTMLLQQ
jgi:hypothetical protein